MPTQLELAYWGGEVTDLTENKWLNLREMKVPRIGINGYVFSHEVRCRGKIVAVLPFRRYPDGSVEVLLRTEIVPPWSLSPQPCAVTGGCDHEGEAPIAVGLRELKEEAGYSLNRLMGLGTCRGTKSTDTTYYLFAADVSGVVPGKAEGDGSALEASGGTKWSTQPEGCNDPLVGIMYARLLRMLNII